MADTGGDTKGSMCPGKIFFKLLFFSRACAAVPGRPRGLQAPVTGGDPEDKKREETEAEREEAEGHREPQALGQCEGGAAESGVCGGALTKACRPRGAISLISSCCHVCCVVGSFGLSSCQAVRYLR